MSGMDGAGQERRLPPEVWAKIIGLLRRSVEEPGVTGRARVHQEDLSVCMRVSEVSSMFLAYWLKGESRLNGSAGYTSCESARAPPQPLLYPDVLQHRGTR